MKNIAVLFLIVILFFACKKDSKDNAQKMPPVTQTGEDILACKVNGSVHIYRFKPHVIGHDGVRFSKIISGNRYSVRVAADKTEDYNDDIDMRVSTWDIELNKLYHFSSEAADNYAEYFIGQGSSVYRTFNNSGSITFTRYDADVVAGRFNFRAYNPDTKDTVNIAEGFFDIKPETF